MSHDLGQTRSNAGRSSVYGYGLEELEQRLLLSASLYDAQDVVEAVEADQAEVVAAATSDLVFGIDVSKWQGTINWTSVANNNDIEFVWAKATEGVDYTDPMWYTNVVGAHNAGLYVGGYHFATPYTSGVNDAADEATDFYAAVDDYLTDGYLRPVLDLEGSNSLTVTQMSNWVHEFMNTFATLSGGIVPVIYTGTTYATSELNSSVNIYDLWYPRWPSDPDFDNPPAAPGIWNSYDLWQYSSTTHVTGIGSATSNVDGDVFLGNIDEFISKYVISTIPDDHGDDVASATAIGLPSTTAGVLGKTTDSDWFELNLVSGVEYTFSVLTDGLSSAELRLRTNFGNEIMMDSGPASGDTLAQITYTPVSTQVYYLSVDSSGIGGYELVVQEADYHGDSIAEASDLNGGFALGGLQTDSDKDYFFFNATAGKQYAIEIISLDLADAVLNLYNSGGAITAQQTGSGGSSPLVHMDWSALGDGVMYISVSSNAGTLGDYVITLVESEPQLEGDLDGDGFVGLSDLDIVLGAWNQSVTAGDWLAGDPSGDGFVGLDDLDIVLDNWNAGTPPVEDSVSSELSETLAAATSEYILGTDVSVWQGTNNWASAAASGIEFAFIRAVDRDGEIDTKFYSNIVQAKAAGIYAGAYQFVTPWTDGYNDAVEEAQLFASVIAPYLTDGYLRPVLDIEAGPPHVPYPIDLDNTVLTNWIHDYMEEFERLTGVQPLIYCNTYYAANAFNSSVNQYDLWLANWTDDPDSPPGGNADGVWNGYDFWQYSGGGVSIPGIGNAVDGDVYFGTVAEMLAEYGITIEPDDHGNDDDSATLMAGVPSATIGTIETIMDTDWFKISLQAGTEYVFSVIAGSASSAEVALYTQAGTQLASNDGPASGGILADLSFTPSYADAYYIRISGVDDVGTYVLSIQEADDHGDTLAEATGPVSSVAFGGIQSNSDLDYFSFNVSAGMHYDIQVFDLGIPDATITLYDSSGGYISDDSGSNPSAVHAQVGYTASSDGVMYVAIGAQTGSYGDYALMINESVATLEGDIDGDGYVGLSDLDLVLGSWNQSVPPADSAVDLSGDGYVGLDDLDIILANWNSGTQPASVSSAVTEPVTASSTEITAASTSVEASESIASSAMLAAWRSEARSAFIEDDAAEFDPAIGLWE